MTRPHHSIILPTTLLALGLFLSTLVAACSDDSSESSTTPLTVPATTVAVSTTVPVPTTVVVAKVPAVSVDDLVTRLYAALNGGDDAGLRALSTEAARHVVYWAGTATAGIQTDFAIANYRMATSGIESIEILGEPILSGATITVPVRYHYPSEGDYIGFDVLVTTEAEGGLLIVGGATIFADQAVTLDPTALAVIEAEHAAWNDEDATAVVANFAADGMFWDNLTDAAATYTGEALMTFVISSQWFDVEITAEPVTSGPFIAVPNRLVAPDDSSEGISIYLIRDGKITLQAFAQ